MELQKQVVSLKLAKELKEVIKIVIDACVCQLIVWGFLMVTVGTIFGIAHLMDTYSSYYGLLIIPYLIMVVLLTRKFD